MKSVMKAFLVFILSGLLIISMSGFESAAAKTHHAARLKHRTVKNKLKTKKNRKSKVAKKKAVVEKKDSYPYLGKHFDLLVKESYQRFGADDEQQFFSWFEKVSESAYNRISDENYTTLEDTLKAKKLELENSAGAEQKTQIEIELGERLHALTKEVITRFSLERGFEFYNAQNTGERQCLLQSVLIAALLQEMGVDAGIVMIYKNFNGQVSNIGHVATLIKLSDGKDIIVDASDREPFIPHQGVLGAAPSYQFLEPVFEDDTEKIVAYKTVSAGKTIPAKRVRPLDFSYVRSQFWYYRGERTEGGLLSAIKTDEGLQEAGDALKNSLSICPANPLSAYMLGRIYLAQNNGPKALAQLKSAEKLYNRYGWIPDGPKEFLKLAKQTAGKK